MVHAPGRQVSPHQAQSTSSTSYAYDSEMVYLCALLLKVRAPCSWSRRSDTELRLAHFRRHKEGAGEKRADLAAKARRRQAGVHVGRSGAPPKWGLDHDNPVTKLVAQVIKKYLQDSNLLQLCKIKYHASPVYCLCVQICSGFSLAPYLHSSLSSLIREHV